MKIYTVKSRRKENREEGWRTLYANTSQESSRNEASELNASMKEISHQYEAEMIELYQQDQAKVRQSMAERMAYEIETCGLETVLEAIERYCHHQVRIFVGQGDNRIGQNWQKLDELTFAVRQTAHVVNLG